MIRIVLTGSECTGKTTLAKSLSRHYGEPWSGEYARSYVEEVQRPLTADDVGLIAKGQLRNEDSILSMTHRFALHDTNLFSTILYASHYYDLQLAWLNETFLQREYSLYLLSTPHGITWRRDPGQRDSPEARTHLHQKFEQSLKRLSAHTVKLQGPQEERFGDAIHAIDSLLKRQKAPQADL